MFVNCSHCNKKFITKPYKVKKLENLFCSRKCSSDFRKGKFFQHKDKRIKLICLNCKAEFECMKSIYKLKGHKFCSFECYQKYRKAEHVNIKCEYCGKKKEVRKSYVERGQYKFCSLECAYKYRRPKEMQNIEKKDLLRKCCVCGKSFYTTLYRHKSVKNYCSMECRKLERKKNRIIKKCKYCNKEFEIKKSEKDKRFFCSKKCYLSFGGETSIEKKVRLFLESFQMEFETQWQYKRYVYDFVIPSLKIAIETDGKYWHSKESVKKRDAKKDKLLNGIGYNVIRLGEDEINNNTFKEKLVCLN